MLLHRLDQLRSFGTSGAATSASDAYAFVAPGYAFAPVRDTTTAGGPCCWAPRVEDEDHDMDRFGFPPNKFWIEVGRIDTPIQVGMIEGLDSSLWPVPSLSPLASTLSLSSTLWPVPSQSSVPSGRPRPQPCVVSYWVADFHYSL